MDKAKLHYNGLCSSFSEGEGQLPRPQVCAREKHSAVCTVVLEPGGVFGKAAIFTLAVSAAIISFHSPLVFSKNLSENINTSRSLL